jgi:hypothetical protein
MKFRRAGHHEGRGGAELARWVCALCGVLQRLDATADRAQLLCVCCGQAMTKATAEPSA